MHIEENPSNVRVADLIVGIPSYNEADLISYPTQMASEGLIKYFGDKNSVIINCDNNSPDGTRDAFMNTPTEVPKVYLSTPPGVKGKGNNFKNLFRKSCDLGAEAIIVLDADLRSVTPRWTRSLAEPLFEGFGFVAPLYVRHKYDGTITNNIAYPMIRSVFGRRVRQPIGGDFGFSGELAEIYLKQEHWSPSVAEFGIDIWMTAMPMCHDIPICQSFMGRPKIHKPKDPGESLGPMFLQVVGTIFDIMTNKVGFWKDIRWSKPTAIYGFGLGEMEMPPPVDVNLERLFDKFQAGFAGWDPLWKGILSTSVYKKLSEVRALGFADFEFPVNLWAEILADFAVSYKNSASQRVRIMESLIPLYFGRTCSFVIELEPMTIQQAEEVIEEQCIIFERSKPDLLKKWFDSR
ncbi:MAG: glycosyl transferase [Desulfobacterales bacterium C00003060]|nr:MAG: glycosyl transferase [Desulfobacterales bacterium C00003060]OEU78776.1 MAG: glycosyl transferase [Desulfobacterales bacterium S5133MH4]